MKIKFSNSTVCLCLLFTYQVQAQEFDDLNTNAFGLQTAINTYSAPILFDFDNDGDDDLLHWTGFGDVEYFENVGSSTQPLFGSPITNPFSISGTIFAGAPTLGDIDGDNDIDLLVGDQNGNFILYPNSGTLGAPNYPSSFQNEYGLSAVNLNATPAFGDIDNDGDLDIFSGDRDGNLTLFTNTGVTPQFPDYANTSLNPFNLSPPTNQGGYSRPFLHDLDIDGDLDLFVGYRNSFVYFENTGTSSAPNFVAPIINPFNLVKANAEQWLSPAFADTDNDGDKDLYVGSFSGRTHYYENLRLPETFIWDGSTSTSWSDPTNWDRGSVPLSQHRVIVPFISGRSARFPFIDVSISVDRVELDLDSKITIGSSGSLTTNTLVLDDTLFVSPEGSLMINDTLRGSGIAEIIRATSFDEFTGRYSAVGSPVAGSGSEILGSTVYRYDETIAYGQDGSGRFIEINTPQILSPTRGYFSAFTGSIVYHGQPNYGTHSRTLVYDEINDGGPINAGFNLVSNPYPAAISLTDFLTGNQDIDGTIYLWDDGGSDISQRSNNDYITITNVGATGGSGRLSDWDGFIRSGQAFFVKANKSGTLNFTPNMASPANNTNNGFFRTGDLSLVRISLSGEKESSQILIAESESSTLGFDSGMDGRKIMSDSNVQLYSLAESEPMAIQAVPPSSNLTVDLGMIFTKVGNYRLQIDELTLSDRVFLFDKYNGHYSLLKEGDSYYFRTQLGKFESRFSIILSPDILLQESDHNQTDHFIAWNNHGQLQIAVNDDVKRGQLSIFSLDGKETFVNRSIELDHRGRYQTSFSYEGICIVMLKTQKGTFTKKIVYKN